MPRSSEQLIRKTPTIVLVTDRMAQGTTVTEAPIKSDKTLTRSGSLKATSISDGLFEQAADVEAFRPPASREWAHSAVRAHQPAGPRKRSWIGRHPVLFGALAGFGGGFLIGYLPGDDVVFDDFTAGFNGWVLGGIGAGTGAAAGAIIGATTK